MRGALLLILIQPPSHPSEFRRALLFHICQTKEGVADETGNKNLKKSLIQYRQNEKSLFGGLKEKGRRWDLSSQRDSDK